MKIEVSSPFIAEMLKTYRDLEPGEADSWNPAQSKFQLGYRLNLYFALARAIERSGVSIPDMRALDLGCGNGRSTRMYLDMGLKPDQVVGMDVRPGTLRLAQALNPAIRFDRATDAHLPLPTGHNWISTATMFSSVPHTFQRLNIANKIYEALKPGDHVFYYDLIRALPHAGRDIIHPERLFPAFKVVWRKRLRHFGCIPLGERLDIATPRQFVSDLLKPAEEAILLRKL